MFTLMNLEQALMSRSARWKLANEGVKQNKF